MPTLLTALAMLAFVGAPNGSAWLPSGHEAALAEAFGPAAHRALESVAGWRLERLVMGPDCAARLHFADDEQHAVVVAVRPVDYQGGAARGRAFELEPGAAAQGQELVDGLRRHAEQLVPASPFAGVCHVTASSAPPIGDGQRPTPFEPSLGQLARFVGFGLLLAVLLVLLGRLDPWLQARWPTPPAGPAPWTRLQRVWLVGCVALAVGLRWHALGAFGPDEYEAYVLQEGAAAVRATIAEAAPYAEHYHPVGYPLLLSAWTHVGEWLGVGGHLWMRAPNLVLAVVAVVVAARLGRLSGAPWTGLGVALLLAGLPSVVALGGLARNYWPETVACLAFYERLATWHLARRVVLRGLVATSLIAVYLGHLSLLLVGAGWLTLLLRRASRDERRAVVAAGLVLAILYLPGLDFMVSGALTMRERQPGETQFWLGGVLNGVVTGLYEGVVPLALLWGGAALALAMAPRAVTQVAMMVGLFVVAARTVETRWPNYGALLPLLLALPTWGLERLGARLGAGRIVAPGVAAGALATLLAARLVAPTPTLAPRSEAFARWTFQERDAAGLAWWLAHEVPRGAVVGVLDDAHEWPAAWAAVVHPPAVTLDGYLSASRHAVVGGDGFLRLTTHWGQLAQGRPTFGLRRDGEEPSPLLPEDATFAILTDSLRATLVTLYPGNLEQLAARCHGVNYFTGYLVLRCVPGATVGGRR